MVREKRKRGTGTLVKKITGWTLRVASEKKGRKRKSPSIWLGTHEELPTKEDAEAAAELFTQRKRTSLIGLLSSRKYSHRPELPIYSAKWFSAKLAEQNGLCAICGVSPKRFVVDHDHDTDQLRGLLCPTCNTGIGMLKDDIRLLRLAVCYLESYNNDKALERGLVLAAHVEAHYS